MVLPLLMLHLLIMIIRNNQFKCQVWPNLNLNKLNTLRPKISFSNLSRNSKLKVKKNFQMSYNSNLVNKLKFSNNTMLPKRTFLKLLKKQNHMPLWHRHNLKNWKIKNGRVLKLNFSIWLVDLKNQHNYPKLNLKNN